MKKTKLATAALMLTTLFSTAALAEEVTLTACTKDGHTATLTMDASGNIGDVKVKTLLQDAFTKTANALTGDVFLTKDGLALFVSNLKNGRTEALKSGSSSEDVSMKLTAAPSVGEPVCSVPAP